MTEYDTTEQALGKALYQSLQGVLCHPSQAQPSQAKASTAGKDRTIPPKNQQAQEGSETFQ